MSLTSESTLPYVGSRVIVPFILSIQQCQNHECLCADGPDKMPKTRMCSHDVQASPTP